MNSPSCRQMVLRRARAMLEALVWLTLAVAVATQGAMAQSVGQKEFDHLRTGFALTGTHVQTRCESCHQNGIFKGTPRDCASCHVTGKRFARGNVVMPQQHLPTQLTCDSCHATTSFLGTRFSHAGVAPGSCQTCHTGGLSTSKPANHIQTSASCDSCHRTNAWAPAASFDHTGVVAGSCATCHGAGRATGKSAQHMPTNANQSCDSCHRGFTAWRPTAWNHTQMSVNGQCATCHSGSFPPADGRPTSHVPYASIAMMASANCDSCHRGSFNSWANGRLHANFTVTTGCATCHSGAFLNAVGKPNTVVHNGVTNCESCHNTAGWAGARVDHSTFTAATNCASCHNGTGGTAKPGNHIPTTANCFACHNVSPARWTPTKWNHTQVPVTAQCATCHTGAFPPADGRPTNHVPYQTVASMAGANCDSCHRGSFSTWANGALHASFSLSTGCASCHNGAYLNAVGKPNNATHATVTGNCESCHRSTASWAGARVDHSTFTAATNCATCHNGTGGTAKPGNHIPTTANCFVCHNVSPALWTPTKWNHTQVPVTAQCATCHSGSYPPADGRPTNHIPYQTVAITAAANCDSCHRGGFTTWANGRLHSYFSISTGCTSCHNGAYLNAVGKPNNATHATVTGNCESCHRSTATWSGARVDHSTFNAATNCASCHNGSGGTGRPGNHIPIGAASCFACHNVSPALWTPTKWTHTQVPVTAQCGSCHTGSYPPADGRPANHIPYLAVPVTAAANCDGCHRGSFTTWTNGRLHSYYSLSTNCSTCHTGAYLMAVGKPNNATHATVTGNCESCHRSATSWSTVTFAHSPANAVGTGTCDTCHNGTRATGKPGTHIPIPAGPARCDSCHRSQANFRTAMTMNHSVVTTAQCKTCHNGAYVSQGPQGALAKPVNHIPEAQLLNGAAMDCNACHTGTTAWTSMTMNHNASLGNGAGWCRGCHLSGTSFLGSLQRKSLSHYERYAGQTDCSASGCHRPLGNTGTSGYRNWTN